ncbi:MAG: hypothetical protein K1W24_03730 [Lachnospiraceae bacterium]
MEEKDCWNKFAVSGKVEDYLEYRSSVETAAHNNTGSTKERMAYTPEKERQDFIKSAF